MVVVGVEQSAASFFRLAKSPSVSLLLPIFILGKAVHIPLKSFVMKDLKYLETPPQPELYAKLMSAENWFGLSSAVFGSFPTHFSNCPMSLASSVRPWDRLRVSWILVQSFYSLQPWP